MPTHRAIHTVMKWRHELAGEKYADDALGALYYRCSHALESIFRNIQAIEDAGMNAVAYRHMMRIMCLSISTPLKKRS